MAKEARQFRIVHTTEYRFDAEVDGLRMTARLKPLDTPFQTCDFHQLIARPSIDRCDYREDAHGNAVADIAIDSRLQRLRIDAVSSVSILQGSLPNGSQNLATPDHRYLEPTALVTIDEAVSAYGRRLVRGDASADAAGEAVCGHLYDHFVFAAHATDVNTTAAQVLERRGGVCQDFVHLSIAILRSLGYPARYVSGYLYTAAFRGRLHRMASDASHAWLEAFDPTAGWIGFDPANGRRADDHYIVLARGGDYQDICPLSGSYDGGGRNAMHVSVDVQRLA